MPVDQKDNDEDVGDGKGSEDDPTSKPPGKSTPLGASPRAGAPNSQGNVGDSTSGEFDFSADPVESAEVPAPQIGEEYDPRPTEDQARKRIAYGLLFLLALLVYGMLMLVSLGTIAVQELKEFAVVLGPVVTLVSAATGFYYGTK